MSDRLASAIYHLEQVEDELSRELGSVRDALEVLREKMRLREASRNDPRVEEAKERVKEWLK